MERKLVKKEDLRGKAKYTSGNATQQLGGALGNVSNQDMQEILKEGGYATWNPNTYKIVKRLISILLDEFKDDIITKEEFFEAIQEEIYRENTNIRL
jgi:hypothetical protein